LTGRDPEEKVLAATRPEGQEGGLGKDVTIRRAMDAAEPKIREAFRDEPGIEASIRDTLGQTYFYLGELPFAIAQLERSVLLRRQTLGRDHPDTLDSSGNLAAAYHGAGRLQEAIRLFEETLKLSRAKLGADHFDTLTTMNALGRAYLDAGQLSESRALLEETLGLRKVVLGPDHPDTLITMNLLTDALLAAKRWLEAEKTARECVALREKKLPRDWRHSQTMIQLGAALIGQENYAEAELPLIQGYESLKAREAKIPVLARECLTAAAARIVRFYEAWGKKDTADQWRTRLKAGASATTRR